MARFAWHRWQNPGGARELLVLAWPLILSNSFFTIQVTINRALLSRYSSESVGAAMAAILLYWTPFSLLLFTANYVTVFIAQYQGAHRPHRIGPAVGQSLYFSLFAGIAFAALIAPTAKWIVALGGHSPELQELEATYLRCLAFAGLPALLTASATCFFTGRGKSRVVLLINAFGFVVNGLLDYAWIGGHWGFPAWGIAGAGWATVIANWCSAALALALMLQPRFRAEFATHLCWIFDRPLFLRILRFGIPNGIMGALEGLSFTFFTFLVGWLGAIQLGATSITFTLNMLVFLPAIGVGQAVEVLVGQRLGEDRPDLAERTTWTALALVIAYMLFGAIFYLLIPEVMILPFANPLDPSWPEVLELVIVLLRFVALYSLLDGINVVCSFALRGAGDTRFVALVGFALAWPTMVVPTWLVTRSGGGAREAWAFATLYICLLAGVFLLRFRQGRWKTMRVIEAGMPEPEAT